MADRALPDVKSRIRLDSTDLDKGSAKAAKFGGDVQKHMETGTTHTLRLKESMTTLIERMGGLPPVVGQSARSIESMASSFSQGASAGGVFGLAAVAGIGLAVGAAQEGIKSYVDLGEKVENYRRVSGASAEDSSRVVETFDRLGVSSDRASSSMFMLSKRIEASPQKFKDLGIEIAYANDGTIDLNKTLLAVADAYTHASSTQEKNTIANTAFGRSSRDLIPVLEQGRAGLQRLEDQAKVIFTEQDLARIRAYKIDQQELKQSTDALGQSLGATLLPVQKAVVESMNEGIYVNQHLSQALKDAGVTGSSSSRAFAQVSEKLREQYRASLDAQHQLDVVTESMKSNQAAADANAAAIDNLVQATESEFNASIALERANLNLTKSANAITDAQAALTKATEDFGPGSRQAADASIALSEAMLAQKEAYLQDAAATQKVAEDQAKMSDTTLSAADSARIYRDRLQALANTLDPASPLRKSLQSYIDELNNQVPGGVNTNLTITTPRSSRAQLDEIRDELAQIKSTAASVSLPSSFSGAHAYASGGRPDPGMPALVGERGPELWIPDRPGTVINADRTSSILGGGADMDETNQLLRDLIDAVTPSSEGQTGVAAALYKAMEGSRVNRARGMSGF